MGKPRFRPQRVLRAADQLLETKRLSSRPPWYTSLERIPPSQILVRPIKQRPVSYEEEEALLRPGQRINPSRSRMAKELRRPKTWAELTSSEARQGRSGSRHELYKPKKILYPEDKLRAEFFGDHPWELARPRVILESGGNDSKNWDWSLGINQPGKQLDGESVIQRQMYLMKHEHMTKPAAYDLARREFYDVRHAQETERRIAKEEALHYGAYFGKSTLEIGEELEDQVWEGWKTSALAHLDEVQAQRTQAVSTFSQEGESDEIPDDGIVAEPQTVEAPMTRGELQGALEEVAPSIPASRRGQEAYGGAPLRPGPTP